MRGKLTTTAVVLMVARHAARVVLDVSFDFRNSTGNSDRRNWISVSSLSGTCILSVFSSLVLWMLSYATAWWFLVRRLRCPRQRSLVRVSEAFKLVFLVFIFVVVRTAIHSSKITGCPLVILWLTINCSLRLHNRWLARSTLPLWFIVVRLRVCHVLSSIEVSTFRA